MVEKHDLVSRVTVLISKVNEEQEIAFPVDFHKSFDDLGFDWLSHAELVMLLEEEFSIIISDEDAQGLVTPQMVVTYLSKVAHERP